MQKHFQKKSTKHTPMTEKCKDPKFSQHLSGDLSPPKNRLRRFFKLRSNQGFPVHVVTRGIGDNMYRKTHLAIKKMKGF